MSAQIIEMLVAGKSYREITAATARRAPTISYHARQIGLTRVKRKLDWAAVQAKLDAGVRPTDCMAEFCIHGSTWSAAVKAGRILSPGRIKAPLETYTDRRSTPFAAFRRRLIADAVLPYQCSECGIDSWRGQPLGLHLDHQNGDRTDNRVENLRFLCPNCHSLTDTYGGRNVAKRRAAYLNGSISIEEYEQTRTQGRATSSRTNKPQSHMVAVAQR